MRNNIFLLSVLQAVPRLLSCIDANPYSQTYGCFDRNFWHYKMVTDFPSAPYQQGTLSLAYLYKENFIGNSYFKNPRILSLIDAGIHFWCSIQHADGSFDEWYPHEHSHVATAFTTYAFSEIYILLKQDLPEKTLNRLNNALQKSGLWLSYHPDIAVTNHTAGAVTALFNIFQITKNKSFYNGLKRNIAVIEKNQNPEGWFLEYGGADPGYTSVSIDYLAKYWIISRDEKIYEILKKSLRFLMYFMHPDGSFGGVYGSRNTSYFLPHGILLLAPYFQEAQSLIKKIYSGLQSHPENYLTTFDNRYLLFFFLSNWLQTGLVYNEIPSQTLMNHEEYFEKNFPNAGFFIKRTQSYFTIVNYKKNGIIKVFSSDCKLTYSDTGYFARLSNGNSTYSSEYDHNRKVLYSSSSLNISGYFSQLKNDLPLVKYLIPFRLWNKTIGKISFASRWLHAYIKKIKIIKKKRIFVSLTRLITFQNHTIRIFDIIKNESRTTTIISISLTNSLSGLHVPSSKFITAPNDFLLDIEEYNTIKKIGAHEMHNDITLDFS